jgi:4-hydroxy-tetrahydrodipicolinate synthase
MFRGSFVALITPFRNGAIDEQSLQSLVEWHIEQGTHGLVPVGTTGESPTLSHAEHGRVVELVIEAAAGRVPVIAGAGSNATAEAITLGRHAKEAGADAILVVTPYYNKPTQAGLYAHYKALNDAVDLPIILYNIPGRSVVDMSVETMAALARLPNIVGVKDATCDLVRPLLTSQACGEDFCQLSGEDGTWLAFLAHGGHGCISVTANVAPGLCSRMQEAWQRGDPAEALAIHRRLMPLHKALFIEASPAPAKYALSRLGKASAEIRLPLVEPSEPSRPVIDAALVSAGLMN